MKVLVTLFAVVVVALSGCSSVQTHRNPKADLSHLKHFYVEHRLTDNNHIDDQIVAELKAMGVEASAGPLTMMPDGVDALVNYEDIWAWDFKSYLIQLSIEIRHPHANRVFAAGTYRQPSLVTKPPADVIREILRPLLVKRNAKSNG